MHQANRLFWRYCKELYPQYFQGNIRVLEYGSYNINGSVREFFGPVDEYTGVDWRPGTDVDLVSLAHQVRQSYKYDTIISASLLEHDPYWESSLENMIWHMQNNSIFLLSWGAALNTPHCFAEAPDGKFHALPAQRVLNKVTQLGLYVHEFKYDKDICNSVLCRHQNAGKGEVNLIAFRQSQYAKGSQIIMPFIPEDMI